MLGKQATGRSLEALQRGKLTVAVRVVVVGVHDDLALQPLRGHAAVVREGNRHQYQLSKPCRIFCTAHLAAQNAAAHAAHGLRPT
ncbi:hypothetical protein D3C72_1594230 [compost metagenome]